MSVPVRALFLLSFAPLLGCERAMQNMYDQPKYPPYAASSLFPHGTSARPLPPLSVAAATGTLADATSAQRGSESLQQDELARAAVQQPLSVTPALLARGRERYQIYCVPCHSPVGDGDGLVTRHGFPQPPSYHTPRLRDAPDRHFYDVITVGYGVMHAYADRVTPADRWAIVAYIRALQLSQHVAVAELPEEIRARLAGAEARGAQP